MTEVLRKNLEILAPAGSVEQLITSVNNGCDAVYLGLDNFNARMKAPNFSSENLEYWIDYCHFYGVKVYVAVNTSIKNDEIEKAVEIINYAYQANADGIIVTDLYLMRLAAKLPKPFEIIASTQLNIHDKSGAEFVKKCGATTVVCARECSLKDIKSIASTGIKVECFLHGAMCVCQSGQCLLSAMVGGNSGNRGLCAQPCRKKYFAGSGSKGYLLSAHDIHGLDTVSKLVEAGVSTFKIEGRNRRAEYAGAASQIYKKVFDNVFAYDQDDLRFLKLIYNREIQSNGYLFGENGKIVYDKCQNHTGVKIGEIKNGFVLTPVRLEKGDGLKVLKRGEEVCGGRVVESGNGRVRAKFDGSVSDGMTVCVTTSTLQCHSISANRRKLSAELCFEAKANSQTILTAKCQGLSVSVHSDFVAQLAISKPISIEEIERQLSKSGNSYFTITDIVTNIDKTLFINKAQLNELRRSALEKLAEAIKITNRNKFVYRHGQNVDAELSNENSKQARECLAVICRSENELAQAENKADYLIFKPDIIDANSVEIACRYGCFMDVPSSLCDEYLTDLLKKYKFKVLCHNIAHVEVARAFGIKYIAGGGLNIFNDYIASEFSDAETFVYSLELTINEIKKFKNKSGLIFTDGKIVLMKLRHCPYKTVYKCDCSNCKANERLSYRDELGNIFDIERRRGDACTFELINGKKLSVVNKLTSKGRYLIDFDNRILSHYLSLNRGVFDGYVENKPYTKGRLYDKVN